ncbi:beta-N-acetylhexosaminidase [Permianibacter aggregans]|uniref:Beta-hexosaminidase n=1 Tax=Permianibacter aggregans TaxID=1510150 RepID=A0A4R6UWW6_9GAMM|nr:beta-N-acetylhexosaminidase [Permianibacter aggregans]QGX38618.1 beta-N-acetylhexosaminidase [Permianibacter aggregans]TDQ50403.1 beta-N-acetylhexosaminidase [Permianibacter aggregans]
MRLGPLMLDLQGPSISAEEAELLAHPVTGAVILFSRNIETPEQVSALCDDIRRKAKRPLLIAVDQEGGRVQRLKEGFSRLPPMREIAAASFTEAAIKRAEVLGWLMAAEVRAVGCDISFAPVLDLDFGHSEVIGDRSFGREPEQVVALIAAFLRGMQQAGMAGTGKHFPGHGFVAADSHTEVPVDRRALAEIENDCLKPFRMLSNALGAVMPAHIIYPEVDDRPAGFSPVWLQQILRQDLGFNGCIFSDDLAMKGATVVGDFRTRAEAALSAGCDMVLVCNDRQGAIDVLQSLPHTIAREQEARIVSLCRQQPAVSLAELRAQRRWQQAQPFLRA